MSGRNLINFLRTVAARADVLNSLKVKSKDEVIAAAASFGFPFTEATFDSLIWDLEVHLARKRGESFDPYFPLWETMWGKYYFEYLVLDVITSVDDADIDTVMTAQAEGQQD
jgi:hypothetical protein